jgi:hypothetical protein
MSGHICQVPAGDEVHSELASEGLSWQQQIVVKTNQTRF